MHDNAWIAGKVVSLSVSYQDTTKSQVSMQTGCLSSQSSGQRSLGVDLTAQRMVQKYPHEVTIYEGGPMTNLALANAIDPHFAELAEGLVFMGGSLSPRTDNPEFISSPRHEFNFWFDPEAAKSVLQAPWKKIVCTPVDISVKTRTTDEMVAEIKKSNSSAARYVVKFFMADQGGSYNSAILVEGEVGYIGSGSELHNKRPENIHMTEPADARGFVVETRVDLLPPSVGMTHGMIPSMVRGAEHKRLDIPRIAAIKDAAQVPLTLHGGSGTDAEDFRKAIKAGITMIQINTELRVAWRTGLAEAVKRNSDAVAPYKLLPDVVRDVKTIVRSRLELFGGSAAAAAQ